MRLFLLSISCALLCLYAFTSQAQTFAWASTLKDSVGTFAGNTGSVITVDNHSHTIVAGSYTGTMTVGSFTLAGADSFNNGYLVKYDSAGNILWTASMPIDDIGNAIIAPLSISTDKNDNIYIGGYYNSGAIHFTATDSLVNNTGFLAISFLAKYDANGKFQWAVNNQAFGESDAITTDPFGNVIWTGRYLDTANFSGVSFPEDSAFVNFYMAKYSTSGSLVWVKSFKLLNLFSGEADIAGIVTDKSGNIYTTGRIQGSTIFGNDTLADTSDWVKVFTAKFDSTGILQWSNTEGEVYDGNYSNGIAIDNNSNVYICGELTDSTLTTIMPFIAKYNTSGTKKWLKKFGNDQAIANGISADAAGDPYIIGDYLDTIVFGSTTLSSGKYSMFVAKFDTAGNALWGLSSKYGNAEGNGICADLNSGNISITGSSFSSDTFGTKAAITSIPGKADNFVAYISNKKPTSITTLLTSPQAIIYPNPATDELYIANANPNTTIKIYNVSGQSVYFNLISSTRQNINISSFAKGVYFVQLTDPSGANQTISFVKK